MWVNIIIFRVNMIYSDLKKLVCCCFFGCGCFDSDKIIIFYLLLPDV